jgi:4-alpha-glucanotransferase
VRWIFQLRFRTHPGQSLLLTGNHQLLGDDDSASAIPLTYLNQEFWQVTIPVPPETVSDAEIHYRYILRNEDGSLTEDVGIGREFNPASLSAEEVLFIDAWDHAGFQENAYSTEPFREVLLKPRFSEFHSPKPQRATHVFRAKAPLLGKDETLCLLGSGDALSNWDTRRPILLERIATQDALSVELDLSKEPFPIEYKYGVYNPRETRFVRYEDGANRILLNSVAAAKSDRGPSRPAARKTILNDGFARLPAQAWRGAGVAIPVFSLRSEASFGVGEFTDLKLLADWCHQTGLKVIQILPVNDTSATNTSADSYPYAAISAFALHPLYLNLSEVASPANQALLKSVESERKRLNALKDLDYEAVMALKRDLLDKLYCLQRDETFRSPDYQQFFAANEHWLVPYAVFCYLRDKNRTPDFSRWATHQKCQPEEIAALASEHSDSWYEVALNFFTQYHLHLQLKEASRYAHSKGVILKGDIAIGVFPHGVDTWEKPELYNMEMQAGAPPDAFGIKGQNWSFPTYNWARMQATGFAWWKQRFEQMGEYFDAFRIDHILGFFRIWSVPIDAVEGILGHFVPAIPVHISEFTRRGIQFDHDRYTKPFITDAALKDVFGAANAETVKRTFLTSRRDGRYELKPEFATQRQVEKYFVKAKPDQQTRQLKEGLYDLISNVILLPEPASAYDQFHFRFSAESTSSFKALDQRTQSQLRDLYIDYFFRRQDEFWRKQGLQKLPALKRVTNMLVCGEDLGMVPACVPETMQQLGLLSLEVQRMPKRSNREFSSPKDAPYLSVVTPGTHDMSTVRGWWKEDRALTQRFFNTELGQAGEAPLECEPWIQRMIIGQHLASPAMCSIFQLQDLLGPDVRLRRANPAEERINVPADANNYWRYRIHLTIEELLRATQFNSELKGEVVQRGR